MELQKIYRTAYVEELKTNIIPSNYLQKVFPTDKTQTLMLSGVENKAREAAQRMIPDATHDIDSAIALYEAYDSLSPFVASKQALWVYLGHNELFEYVQKRWKVTDETTVKGIKDYWFDYSERGSLSGLWWSVKMTVDNNRPDKYELTRILFRNQTFRTRTFFTYKIGKHKEALWGILAFMSENSELFRSSLEARLDYVTTYFSRLGSTKELMYMDKQFFYNELDKKRKAIELAVDRNNVRHNRAIWSI